MLLSFIFKILNVRQISTHKYTEFYCRIKQKVLIEQLHNENLKLAWSQNSPDYQEMFKAIQIYRDKLVNIKKDMRILHEKSTKLKVFSCSNIMCLTLSVTLLFFRKEL